MGEQFEGREGITGLKQLSRVTIQMQQVIGDIVLNVGLEPFVLGEFQPQCIGAESAEIAIQTGILAIGRHLENAEIIAGTQGEYIPTGTAPDLVIAPAGIDIVVAGTAVDAVVTGETVDQVIRIGSVEDVTTHRPVFHISQKRTKRHHALPEIEKSL